MLRYNGTPTPGARLAIEVEGSRDPGTTYQWVQFEGPAVALDNPGGPKIHCTVPPDARSLGFLLLIRDAQGQQRTARIVIPIEGTEARAAVATTAPTRPSGAMPRADAGDDQIGLVGRRITLNGARSLPRGVVFRWFALAGPKVDQAAQDGCYFAFTPTAAGTYRFGLVVASVRAGEASISEMDEVVVTVGEVPSGLVNDGSWGNSRAAIDQMLQGPGADAGRITLQQAAAAFESVASRASLYTSFADLSSEAHAAARRDRPDGPELARVLVPRRLRPAHPARRERDAPDRSGPAQPPGAEPTPGPGPAGAAPEAVHVVRREFRSRAQAR